VAFNYINGANMADCFAESHITGCATEELKVRRFEPEYLGELGFYLEGLDRDVRKPHEQPSIGLLLCASKDDEVVEYALSRSLSPALIAGYQTQLPDKKLLQAKLHEFYLQNAPEEISQRSRRLRKSDGST
jgi:YhcG PDDEXK nuclease domain